MVIAAALALAGCQDGDAAPASDKPPSSTSAPTAETSEEVEAASGPLVRGDVFTVNVPQGWAKDEDFSVDFLDQFSQPSGLQRIYVGELAGEVRPLNEVAQDNFSGFAPIGTKRKSQPGELAGDPAYHFTADSGDGLFAEEFLTVHEGTQVTFGVELSGTKAQRQAVIDSVLATWEWK